MKKDDCDGIIDEFNRPGAANARTREWADVSRRRGCQSHPLWLREFHQVGRKGKKPKPVTLPTIKSMEGTEG